MKQALIGSHGTVGSTLLQHMLFDKVYNSHNIHQLCDCEFDRIVVAAPSGNRLMVNNNPELDRANVQMLAQAVAASACAHVMLISSVDAVAAKNTHYGAHRSWLEQQITSTKPTTVLRLSTLIGSQIKKNILYDIKHSQFLHHINASAQTQWCVLSDIPALIRCAKPGAEVNVVSEPILHQDIVQRYMPGIELRQHNQGAVYDLRPYCYTKQEIFSAMDAYMQ